VDQVADLGPGSLHAPHSVGFLDVIAAPGRTPGVEAHELDHERVAAGALDRDLERRGRDVPPRLLDRDFEGAGYVLAVDPPELAPIRAPQERRSPARKQRVHLGRKAGAGEGDVAALTERVLHDVSQVAQVGQGRPLVGDLVHRDQHADPTAGLADDVDQQVQLRAQARGRGVQLLDLALSADAARQGHCGEL
jgi:hypothetical protein